MMISSTLVALSLAHRRPEPRWIAAEREAATQARWICQFSCLLDATQLRRLKRDLRDTLLRARLSRPHRSRDEIAALRRANRLPLQPGGVLPTPCG